MALSTSNRRVGLLGLQLRALLSKRALWKLIATFLACVGALVLFVEFVGLFKESGIHFGGTYIVPTTLVLVVISIVVCLPPARIHEAIPRLDATVTIQVGDVLRQAGNILVGTNDCFDTDVVDGVISPDSVQGQVLKRSFRGDRNLLDRLIEDDLAKQGASGQLCRGKSFGKRSRYPLGTVAVVESGRQRFFFVAYASMTDAKSVETDIESLNHALSQAWSCVRLRGQQEPVHMPIVGTRFARLNMSRNLALQLSVISFLAATSAGPRVASDLTVHVRREDATHIDFSALHAWLQSAAKGFS